MTELEAGHFLGDSANQDAERHYKDERARRDAFQQYVSLVRRYAPAGRWLDIGCGTGTLMRAAADAGITIEGIEVSPWRAAIARQIIGSLVYDRPLEELKLPTASYAAVTLINVFSHLVSPTDTLAEVCRILMPGGVVLLHTSEIGPGAKRSHIYDWDLGNHLYYLGPRTIERYAAKLDMILVHRDRVWLPGTVYTRERFTRHGRSALRNTIKRVIVTIPGALPAFRWYMLKLQAGNPVHTANLVLRKAS